MQTLQITGEEFARLFKRLLDTARANDSYARVVATPDTAGIKLTVDSGDASIACAKMVENDFADKASDFDRKTAWREASSVKLEYGKVEFSIAFELTNRQEVSDEAE